MANGEGKLHRVVLEGRKRMEIGGVCEVESFDESSAILKTSAGEMTVEGRSIKVEVLDTEGGRVVLVGDIDAIIYSTPEEGKRGFFSRGRK